MYNYTRGRMKYLLMVMLCASAINAALHADRKQVYKKHKQQAGIYKKEKQQ